MLRLVFYYARLLINILSCLLSLLLLSLFELITYVLVFMALLSYSKYCLSLLVSDLLLWYLLNVIDVCLCCVCMCMMYRMCMYVYV